MVSIKKSANVSVKKPKKDNKGAIRAIGAAEATRFATMPVSLAMMSALPKFSKNLNQDEVVILNEAADKVLNEVTNLSKKGVKIRDYRFAGINITGIPDKVLEIINPLSSVAAGKNAAFFDRPVADIAANTVLVNREKLPLATFHELGHAFNFNNSKFWAAMQKMRQPGMKLAGLFAVLPALTKDAKAQDGKELTKGQKFKNGLRKASPVLAGLAMIPTLAEEGMASVRGQKWANQLLNKSLSKKVAKFNATGYASYLLATAGLVLASVVGKKVKDNIQAKQNQKKIKI